MLKKLLIIISLLFITGCTSGGTECPDRDMMLKYEKADGSIALVLIGKGELDERAVVSEKECKELIEKYKAERR